MSQPGDRQETRQMFKAALIQGAIFVVIMVGCLAALLLGAR